MSVHQTEHLTNAPMTKTEYVIYDQSVTLERRRLVVVFTTLSIAFLIS